MVSNLAEREDGYAPPLGFMWLVRAWKKALSNVVCTIVLSIKTYYFNWPIEIEEADVRPFEQYRVIWRNTSSCPLMKKHVPMPYTHYPHH